MKITRGHVRYVRAGVTDGRVWPAMGRRETVTQKQPRRKNIFCAAFPTQSSKPGDFVARICTFL